MSITKTCVPLLPVINDCIRHGSRDTLGHQEVPTLNFHMNRVECKFHFDTKKVLSSTGISLNKRGKRKMLQGHAAISHLCHLVNLLLVQNNGN